MRTAVPRWAVSFADLALLLLAFFVMLQAGNARQVAAGARAAFSSEAPAGQLIDAPASELFEPGEARLLPHARARLQGVGRTAAAAKRSLLVQSRGLDGSAKRFDAWELSAARSAALARALEEGGLRENRIEIGFARDGAAVQRLTVKFAD
jgi:flagellar motor protein MotB